jgi:NAD(P)H-flavin reductase
LGNISTLNKERFKLVLYVSFPNRAQAVGLELFEALEKYCKKKGIINFELHLRLSQENLNPGRWDENFVLNEMKKFYPSEVNRVWVCGPPVMNETFERAFDTETFSNYQFKREQFEIL